jgi:hypothetical protein
MRDKTRTIALPPSIRDARKHSNETFALTRGRHQKRLQEIHKIIEAWNSLAFFFDLERGNRLLADLIAECYCSAIGSTICALSGYYRASFFYLRDIIELTKVGMYATEKGLSTLDYLPSTRKLGPVFNNCVFIKKYNEWCITAKEGNWCIKKILDNPGQVISKHAIHLGSEAINWQKSIPSYSRAEFSIFAGAFTDMGKVLLYLWVLFDVDTAADNKSGKLLASMWRVLYPFHRRYFRTAYESICVKMPSTRAGVLGWLNE